MKNNLKTFPNPNKMSFTRYTFECTMWKNNFEAELQEIANKYWDKEQFYEFDIIEEILG